MHTTTVNGVHLITEGDMVVQALEERGSFEPDSFSIWASLCGHGSTVVDVGAYTGLYAIAAARRGARAVAFEPHPLTFKRMRENCHINFSSVVAHDCAAWDQNTHLTLSTKSDVKMSSASNLMDDGPVKYEVRAIEIDSLKLKDVSAIKIDAEGTEDRVLAGALCLVIDCRPVILTEQLSKESGKAVSSILKPLGYDARQLSQNMVVWERHGR